MQVTSTKSSSKHTFDTMPTSHIESSLTPNAKKYLQEVDLSDECKQLISSLPKDKGLVFTKSNSNNIFDSMPTSHIESSPTPNTKKYLQEDDASDEGKQLISSLPKDKGLVFTKSSSNNIFDAMPTSHVESCPTPNTKKYLQEDDASDEGKQLISSLPKDKGLVFTKSSSNNIFDAMPTSHIESSPTPNTKKYLQEDDVSDKCKQLISTLPKDKGWVCTNLFQYQGFWHTSRQLQGVLNCQSNFQALETDILLITTPKSGTTWLKALLFTLVNRSLHDPVKTLESHPLTTQNPHVLVPFLELKLYGDAQNIPELAAFPSPRLFSTHLPTGSLPRSVLDSGSKIVYLCRDPCDTFISLWHFTNKLRSPKDGPLPLEEAFERFCGGVSLYGPFWDHVLGYWKQSLERPSKVMFLKYEEVKEDPVLCVKRLAKFVGCPFSPEEDKVDVIDAILKLCSFENLSSLEVNRNGKLDTGEEYKAFFRQGKVGDFKNYLTPAMVERFGKISEEKLHGSGLKF